MAEIGILYFTSYTYLGMTAPMALIALISWLRNPFDGNQEEVRVNRLARQEWLLVLVLTGIVTFIFFFILRAFHTANLLHSTLSVATSFVAVYLTYRRSAFFALAYAANDIILIILWVLAAQTDATYLSVVICFGMSLINDLYGFWNWLKTEKRQSLALTTEAA